MKPFVNTDLLWMFCWGFVIAGMVSVVFGEFLDRWRHNRDFRRWCREMGCSRNQRQFLAVSDEVTFNVIARAPRPFDWQRDDSGL